MSRGRILLLENIHQGARENLVAAGFEVDLLAGSLSEEELVDAIRDVTAIGIRSKTQLTPKVLEAASRLTAVGAFCIGTNQIALDEARRRGVPVFNAPFSNTRSVAEMVIAEIVFLARQLGDRSREVHQGVWKKVAAGCHEVRGKTLGIVGYGHIGRQVGVLAEVFGMNVLFYDIAARLPMGNNRPAGSLDELLEATDFVTLHVPATPQTRDTIGAEQLEHMKKGAYLLNLSRGNVVVIEDLVAALESGHLAGAAIDVYPQEPKSNAERFESPLQNLPNVILSPHIGGSTVEAQVAIGQEVSTALLRYLSWGSTLGSVNFPAADLAVVEGRHRIRHVHRNVPGVLGDVNRIVAGEGANVLGQVLMTDPQIGYLLVDVEQDRGEPIVSGIAKLETTVRVDLLY
ncbi:MAG: phosphoglycerate dehydrogenase [Sandaracinaceae bacterium]|nr:phosphoglycerate dehydrogenase [Sandaracinaceae bacterium]